MQKIFSSTIAATGKQLKQSVKVFHNLMLYLLLPASAKREKEIKRERKKEERKKKREIERERDGVRKRK